MYYSNQPKLLFVDLRDEEDYAKSHLDNFVNIPYSEGKEDIFFKFLDDNKYDEKTIVLMCYSGNRASEMFNIMYEKGYRKVYLVNMKCDKLFSANSNNVSTGACNCLE
ncbi:MAG: rhodanese-like domain-containing protein [Eubacterium sp.]